MRKIILSLVLLAWSGVAVAQALEEKKQIEPDDSPEAQEMNNLTEKGLNTAVKIIAKAGNIYPFGLILRENGKIATAGYTGDREDQPPPMEWAQAMIWQLRKAAGKDLSIKAIAVFRLHTAETMEGGELPGVWVLVDHRNHRPWTVFLPLKKQADGKHAVGELVYYPTPDDQKIFLSGAKEKSGE